MITLYHLAISHYNEKARWALELKHVPHRRKAMVPGIHRLQAPRIAGRPTLPGLVDDETGERVGESSAILQYLDERFPEPALYPADPVDRARVLEVEEFLDDNVGTTVRAYSYGHLIDFPRALKARWRPGLSAGQGVVLDASFPLVRRVLRRRYGLTPDNTVRRGDKINALCDQVETWLGESGTGYLHGESFGAADLTAACLFGPLTRPVGSPWEAPPAGAEVIEPGFPPPAYEAFRAGFMDRETGRWALGVWERHRQPGAGRSERFAED